MISKVFNHGDNIGKAILPDIDQILCQKFRVHDVQKQECKGRTKYVWSGTQNEESKLNTFMMVVWSLLLGSLTDMCSLQVIA